MNYTHIKLILRIFDLQEFYYSNSKLPSSTEPNNGWARNCYFDEDNENLFHITINSPLAYLHYSYKYIDDVGKYKLTKE